jgi:uncharacterized protein (TIGR01777 family)
VDRLSPPWSPVVVVARDADWPAVGSRTTLRALASPLPWVMRSTACTPPTSYTEDLERGPFQRWRHEHRFADGTLTDTIEFQALLGLGGGALSRRVHRTFAFRHARTAIDLARHGVVRDQPRMTVAVTGATGLLGTELVAFLRSGGDQVLPISRSSGGDGNVGPRIRWDPEHGKLDGEALEGVDAVVHLAGETIAQRWTAERKERIRSSRIGSTELLVRTLAGLKRKPAVLVCGSAVGWYGDRGEEELTEDAPAGDGFLADVARAWEAAAARATELGIRVVQVRTGLVLSGRGGILHTLVPLTRAGAGGRVGSGRQWQPWVAIDDWVGAVHAILRDPRLSGPTNLVAPSPVRQADLAATLGTVLQRPSVMPAPASAVGLVLGAEMAHELVLASQRVVPARLTAAGFRFAHPDLEGALRFELGAMPA